MKRTWLKLIILCLMLMLCRKNSMAQSFDLGSVDAFFSVAEKMKSGESVTEDEWRHFFETKGYGIVSEHFGQDMVKRCITLAFDPQQKKLCDSILSNELTNQSDLLIKFTVNNYVDMTKHWDALKEYRKTYDFEGLKERAIDVLKDFLSNPNDSLIQFPSLTFLCFDANGRKLNKGISIDLNFTYKRTTEENARFLAHEMFHAYRGYLYNEELVNSSPAIKALSRVQNEGIADLIDKESLESAIDDPLVPKEIVKQYVDTYNNTPALLQKLDTTTIAYLKGDVKEAEFKSIANNLFLFDGHANGYYMASLIKRHGFLSEITENPANPVVFARTYNKAAKLEGSYMLSSEFMNYIEKLESKYEGLFKNN